MKNILDKIVHWGHTDNNIEVIILEGLRGNQSDVDELSDYDINIFGNDLTVFLTTDVWMESFGKVLIYQKTQFISDQQVIPTRLENYIDPEKIEESLSGFGSCDPNSLWNKLFHMMSKYRESGERVSDYLSIKYPVEKDNHVYEMILGLRNSM